MIIAIHGTAYPVLTFHSSISWLYCMMNPATSCFSASIAKGCDDRTKEQAKKVKSHDAPGPTLWLVPPVFIGYYTNWSFVT